LDVLPDLLTQLAFDGVVFVDILADAGDFVVCQVANLGLDGDVSRRADLLSGGAADAKDIAQGDFGPLLTRYVNACDTRQGLPLPLLVAWVGADDAYDAVAAHDLAFFAAFSD